MPSGVRVQKPYKQKNIIGYEPPVEVENWDEELQASTTSMWEKPIVEEVEIMGDYMSMSKLTVMLVQATQELAIKVDNLELKPMGSINLLGDFEKLKQEIKDELKPEIQQMVNKAVEDKINSISLWSLIKMKLK